MITAMPDDNTLESENPMISLMLNDNVESLRNPVMVNGNV